MTPARLTEAQRRHLRDAASRPWVFPPPQPLRALLRLGYLEEIPAQYSYRITDKGREALAKEPA